MAKDRVIEINGEIGPYGYGMGYVNYMLKQLGEGPITVKCSSFGGDVSHALKIKNLFQEHGEVTVEYIGFNASSATLIGHGAAKTLIHEDSMYMIHKPSMWVDAWGQMNEDQLANAITELQSAQKSAEACTLLIAQDYVNSRGMKLEDVMKLMKEERWILAKDAVQLGLVDELISSKKKPVVTNQAMAMMNSLGYPVPVTDVDAIDQVNDPDNKNGIIRKIFGFLNFSNQNNNAMKIFQNVLSLLAITGMESKDGVISLTEDQIQKIDDELKVKSEEITRLTNELKAKGDDVTRLTNELATSNESLTNAESQMTDAVTLLDAVHASVRGAASISDKIAAVQVIVDAKPGDVPLSPASNKVTGQFKDVAVDEVNNYCAE